MGGECGSLLQAASLEITCSSPVFFAGYTPVAPAPGAGAVESVGNVAQQSVLLLSNTCTEQFTFTLGSEQDVLPSCQSSCGQVKRWASAASQSLLYGTGCMPHPAQSCCVPPQLRQRTSILNFHSHVFPVQLS